MNHQYIDQHDIAGQYLRKQLAGPDRDAFQAHLVDCAECANRVLLAEMFHGKPAADPDVIPMPGFTLTQPPLPLRARIVAHLSPWTLGLLLVGAVAVILAAFGAIYWWEIQNVRTP